MCICRCVFVCVFVYLCICMCNWICISGGCPCTLSPPAMAHKARTCREGRRCTGCSSQCNMHLNPSTSTAENALQLHWSAQLSTECSSGRCIEGSESSVQSQFNVMIQDPDACIYDPQSLTPMHVCMMYVSMIQISMIFDPVSCIHGACIDCMYCNICNILQYTI